MPTSVSNQIDFPLSEKKVTLSDITGMTLDLRGLQRRYWSPVNPQKAHLVETYVVPQSENIQEVEKKAIALLQKTYETPPYTKANGISIIPYYPLGGELVVVDIYEPLTDKDKSLLPSLIAKYNKQEASRWQREIQDAEDTVLHLRSGGITSVNPKAFVLE